MRAQDIAFCETGRALLRIHPEFTPGRSSTACSGFFIFNFRDCLETQEGLATMPPKVSYEVTDILDVPSFSLNELYRMKPAQSMMTARLVFKDKSRIAEFAAELLLHGATRLLIDEPPDEFPTLSFTTNDQTLMKTVLTGEED